MTTTTDRQPGVEFDASDGNYNPVKAMLLKEGEPTDFALDLDGNEVRAGDWVEIAAHADWIGEVVYVDKVRRATVYSQPHGPIVAGAWSPDSLLNLLDVTRRDRWHTSVPALKVRKAHLTREDKLRIELITAQERLVSITERVVKAEQDRFVTVRHIRELERLLADEAQ